MMPQVRKPVCAAALTALLLSASASLAQTPPADQPGPGLWQRPALLGDMGGLRPALGRHGITLDLQYQPELWARLGSGFKHGVAGDGLVTLTLGMDGKKALGWTGARFNLSVLGIYGPDFSAGYLGNLQTVSGNSATPSVRLWELWYQQALLDGRLSIRLGQQSVDQEFMVSQGSALFLNTMMGWPMVPSADLYAGGPAYPLSSLAIRVKDHPTTALTVLGGVFQDNPPGGSFDNDSQVLGATRYGFNFNLRTGALLIAEVQYAVNPPNPDGTASGLPGTYKIGAWFDTARFPDQRFASNGGSLASPRSNGTPLYHWHNDSLYAVADQTVWRPGGDDPRALSLFVRPMIAPSDRNLIDFSINGGVTMTAPLRGRRDDTLGVGFGVANVSARAQGLDRDTARFTGGYVPVRGAETFLEVTYQAQLTPWLQVQPDFQYFWMPGGGIADPTAPTRRLGNEAVFGLRISMIL